MGILKCLITMSSIVSSSIVSSTTLSMIKYVYSNDPILASYTKEEFDQYGPNITSLRQVSQITYYGPNGVRSIYIEYDEQCDDIFIYDNDQIYSVNGGNMLCMDDIEIYDITIKEILEYLIEEDFDIYVRWVENGRPNSVLNERVFQAPLNQIDVYYVLPFIPYVPFIPEECNVMDYYNGFDTGFNEGFDTGFNEGFDTGFNEGFDNGFNEGFDTGFNEGFDNGFNEGFDTGLNEGFDAMKDINDDTNDKRSTPYPTMNLSDVIDNNPRDYPYWEY